MKLSKIFGIAGVPDGESATAYRWHSVFEWLLIPAALAVLVRWYLDIHGVEPGKLAYVMDWMIWALFVTETAVLTILTRKKLEYVTGNWINLVIIVAGFPVLWAGPVLAAGLRNIRLVLFALMLGGSTQVWRGVISRLQLGPLFALASLCIFAAGIFIDVFEPGIDGPMEGIWWAWVTVTTVGYGDVVPMTEMGRLFAGFVMLIGIAMVAILTAAISAHLIGQDEEEKSQQIHARLDSLDQRLIQLENTLERFIASLPQSEENNK
ncbi:MAG: potassium channel protein [Lysobacteraceae bacterium]|nr:MAG: potassium channel protein [Xanthomonadaceae bacterium]